MHPTLVDYLVRTNQQEIERRLRTPHADRVRRRHLPRLRRPQAQG